MSRSRFAISFGAHLELDLVVGDETTAEAVVVPQDVNLILDETRVIEDTRETPQDVLAGAHQQRSLRPGSVVATAREALPLLLQAVVYDFARTPPTSPEFVFDALLNAFEEARRRGVAQLSVKPLGTAHAGLEPSAFLNVLASVCYSAAELGTTLRRVHLLLPSRAELARYELLLQEVTGRRERP